MERSVDRNPGCGGRPVPLPCLGDPPRDQEIHKSKGHSPVCIFLLFGSTGKNFRCPSGGTICILYYFPALRARFLIGKMMIL